MKRMLAISALALGLGLSGCTLTHGALLPAVNGHQCWSPEQGWQETTNGLCVYEGPTLVLTPPPADAPAPPDPCLILEGCQP